MFIYLITNFTKYLITNFTKYLITNFTKYLLDIAKHPTIFI